MDFYAILYKNITLDYNFVSVNSSCHPGTIFQGILVASPKNEIIRRALVSTRNDVLQKEYHYFCKKLFKTVL